MIPWMRDKFNEKRAKWLARNKQRHSNETEISETSSTTQRTASSGTGTGSGSGSDAGSSLSLRSGASSSLQVHHHVETQTDGSGAGAGGGGVCILRTPSPARRRRIQLELQLQQQEAATRKKEKAEQANTLFLRKNNARLSTASATIVSDPDALVKIGETITVRVICPSSRVLIFKTDMNKRLNDLKSEVILELSDDPDSIQLFAPDVRHLNPRYRLYRAEYFGSELNESQTLAQLHVRHNETFILSPKRNTLSQAVTRTREVPGPNDALVDSATRFVPNNTCTLPIIDINEIFQQSNIQYDVRKVLISLAQASAAIIGAGPFAPRLISMLKQRLVNRRNHQADTVQCLVDMGFNRQIAENALHSNNGVYSTTLEWLIQNQREEEDPQQQLDQTLPTLQRSFSSISPSTILTDNESIENTAALLQIVRIYSHRDTPPNEEIVGALTDMGFDEAAVLLALRMTGNNKASACDWLCENRSASVIELREGLSPDSPILKVILEMPQVQMTLSNPKTFLAFLAILENENAIRVWRGDNDTTSVITHILQKYHEEKHVMGINQFYLNRW
ncbi:ubiquitin-associated domain-containing protein 1 [Drosophila grimshawi]|uniref:ubiquitin-associated domain-containing protein 1 n=1 Tax=Drosophila grimshawi TaxID=7222 RepID=UPI000C8704AB|nr:ubiquitin-associated domain-containing protein 1 [Drosophila grimshawi]